MRNTLKTKGMKSLAILPLLPLLLVALAAFPQQAAAQSITDLGPPQGEHYDEGETVEFSGVVEDVALGDISSVFVNVYDNSMVLKDTVTLSHTGTVTKGERFAGFYTIPYDWLPDNHSNMKWRLTAVTTGGSIYGPSETGKHVIHVHEALPPNGTLIVNLDPEAGGSFEVRDSSSALYGSGSTNTRSYRGIRASCRYPEGARRVMPQDNQAQRIAG